MGKRNTAALRALDRDVFEPLNRAQTLKDEITLLHANLSHCFRSAPMRPIQRPRKLMPRP
jgi:hypothetical protein